MNTEPGIRTQPGKEPTTTEHRVTPNDLRKLLAGEGGIDLRAIHENGKQVAMRIVGVRPGTTAARLGANNDDTIESINGMPLTSIPAAYAAGNAAVRDQRITIIGKRASSEPYVLVLNVERD